MSSYYDIDRAECSSDCRKGKGGKDGSFLQQLLSLFNPYAWTSNRETRETDTLPRAKHDTTAEISIKLLQEKRKLEVKIRSMKEQEQLAETEAEAAA